MIFLAGIPRSGSTLLASLINQRPDALASHTSNLCDTMGGAVMAWEQNPTTQASRASCKDLVRLLRSMAANRYDTDKLVFDKSRGWSNPTIMNTMKMVQGDVKIVATVRPVSECLASFAKIANVEQKHMKAFCKSSQLASSLFDDYYSLKAGFETVPDNFLFIEYDDLVANPQEQLDRVADFTGLSHFNHDPKTCRKVGRRTRLGALKIYTRFVQLLQRLSIRPRIFWARSYSTSIPVVSSGTTSLSLFARRSQSSFSTTP